MKQPLHRKKLQLALQALGSEEDDLKGKLDHNWVTSECDVLLFHINDCNFPPQLLNQMKYTDVYFRVAG